MSSEDAADVASLVDAKCSEWVCNYPSACTSRISRALDRRTEPICAAKAATWYGTDETLSLRDLTVCAACRLAGASPPCGALTRAIDSRLGEDRCVRSLAGATRRDPLARMLGNEQASLGTVYIPICRAAKLYDQNPIYKAETPGL
jgi:hypothetical protein